jgi:hypothetical protein
MIDVTPKAIFVDELARLTEMPMPVVRHRIRHLFEAGIGPRRNVRLTYSAMADYLIGFLAGPSHIDAPAIAARYGAFRLVSVNDEQRANQALDLLVGGQEPTLKTLLTALIEARAAESTVHVLDLKAAWPPADEFAVRLTEGAGLPPLVLTFAAQMPVRKRLRPATSWPIRHEATMAGHVIDGLAHLGAPDDDDNTTATTDQGVKQNA